MTIPKHVKIISKRRADYTVDEPNDFKRLIVEITTGRKTPSEYDLKSICNSLMEELVSSEGLDEITFFFWDGNSAVGEVVAQAGVVYIVNSGEMLVDFYNYNAE